MSPSLRTASEAMEVRLQRIPITWLRSLHQHPRRRRKDTLSSSQMPEKCTGPRCQRAALCNVLLCSRENHETLCKPCPYLSSLPVETKAYCYLQEVGYVDVLIVPRALRTRADARPWARGQMEGHGFRGQLGGTSQLKTELQWSSCEMRRPMSER